MTEIAKLLARQSSHRSQIQVNKSVVLTLGDGDFQ